MGRVSIPLRTRFALVRELRYRRAVINRLTRGFWLPGIYLSRNQTNDVGIKTVLRGVRLSEMRFFKELKNCDN